MTDGLDALMAAAVAVQTAGVAAVQAAAAPILAEARRLAPVRTGKLRDGLAMTVKPTARGAKAVIRVVGSEPGGDLYHEALATEYGTSNQRARPFMRPALEIEKAAAAARFEAVLADHLKGL